MRQAAAYLNSMSAFSDKADLEIHGVHRLRDVAMF